MEMTVVVMEMIVVSGSCFCWWFEPLGKCRRWSVGRSAGLESKMSSSFPSINAVSGSILELVVSISSWCHGDFWIDSENLSTWISHHSNYLLFGSVTILIIYSFGSHTRLSRLSSSHQQAVAAVMGMMDTVIVVSSRQRSSALEMFSTVHWCCLLTYIFFF